jgi:hypothetical protein
MDGLRGIFEAVSTYNIQREMVGCLMTAELQMIWTEVDVILYRYYPGNLAGGSKQNQII